MNYRHAFHAGNFADCMKHALLVQLVQALLRKPAGFCVLDAHAGVGRYDLSGAEATRSGEWARGIGRLLEAPDPALAAYLGLVQRLGLYPGSPALVRALLRPQDRLICCELHPQDVRLLQQEFAGDRQVAVHHRDAGEAMRALLPPTPRRGLVLLDPPYEAAGEHATVVANLVAGHARFPGAIFAAWYPIKHLTPVRALHQSLQATTLRDVIAVELTLREPLDPTRLNGCGLIVINPPYGFAEAASPILRTLQERLSDSGGSTGVLTLVHE